MLSSQVASARRRRVTPLAFLLRRRVLLRVGISRLLLGASRVRALHVHVVLRRRLIDRHQRRVGARESTLDSNAVIRAHLSRFVPNLLLELALLSLLVIAHEELLARRRPGRQAPRSRSQFVVRSTSPRARIFPAKIPSIPRRRWGVRRLRARSTDPASAFRRFRVRPRRPADAPLTVPRLASEQPRHHSSHWRRLRRTVRVERPPGMRRFRGPRGRRAVGRARGTRSRPRRFRGRPPSRRARTSTSDGAARRQPCEFGRASAARAGARRLGASGRDIRSSGTRAGREAGLCRDDIPTRTSPRRRRRAPANHYPAPRGLLPTPTRRFPRHPTNRRSSCTARWGRSRWTSWILASGGPPSRR